MNCTVRVVAGACAVLALGRGDFDLSRAAAAGADGQAPRVRVAGIVLKWVRGDKEQNFRRIEPMIREAAKSGAQIVVTTECFLDGYAIQNKSIPLETYRALGEPIPTGAYYTRLAGLARELKIYLAAGMLEADGSDRFNTAVFIGPDGKLLGKYRKQNLGHELVRNTPGSASLVHKTPLGKIGLMICADRTDPAIVRRFRDNGAEFLICLSGGMFGPKRNDWILQARSKENHLPIVFVHPAEFLVTGPDGSVKKNALIGNRLFLGSQFIGGELDSRGICYVDLPLVPVSPAKSSAATADKPSPGQDPEYVRKMIPTKIAGEYQAGKLTELRIADRKAYVVVPTGRVDPQRRWVWEFPFWLGINDGHGRLHHRYYTDRLLAAGFHVAGIDVGTSCGSPAAADRCHEFYKLLVERYGLYPKARLIGQSNGGLIAYAWAFRHPECVDRIAGICPATDFRTWPSLPVVVTAPEKGLDYGLPLNQLAARMAEFNPIDNLAPLAQARVKILHIHGDKDDLVPTDANSFALERRYKKLGGSAQVVVLPGLGHGGLPLYESRPLIDFLLARE